MHGAHGQAGHAHGHHDHHHHHHAPANHDRAFAIGVALNAGFVLAEVAAGLIANSVALLADAMHNLGDVLALLLAWGASWLARRPPTATRTYGWGRSSILAALVNAILLLLALGGIAWEALERLGAPQPIDSGLVAWVGGIGIAINAASAALFLRGRAADINIRAAFLHMAADALVSAGVVAAALLVGLTGWLWLDPLASLIIAALIAVGTWDLLRDAMGLALDRVPRGIDPARVRAALAALPGVAEVHDLHIWSLSTTAPALTAHLVRAPAAGPDAAPDAVPGLLARAREMLAAEFALHHATLQIETAAEAESCPLRSDRVV
jgi:cobalt-zinc-cadmium efflux system protein